MGLATTCTSELVPEVADFAGDIKSTVAEGPDFGGVIESIDCTTDLGGIGAS